MNVTRAQVVTALKELGVDPATTDEVMIFPDKVIVRQRAVMMIEDQKDAPDEHAHAHG